jgi:hypothetical protein
LIRLLARRGEAVEFRRGLGFLLTAISVLMSATVTYPTHYQATVLMGGTLF